MKTQDLYDYTQLLLVILVFGAICYLGYLLLSTEQSNTIDYKNVSTQFCNELWLNFDYYRMGFNTDKIHCVSDNDYYNQSFTFVVDFEQLEQRYNTKRGG